MNKRKQPNWREPEDYKSLEKANAGQWAWEFLKRNPAYLAEWTRLTQGWTDEEKELNRPYLLCHAHKWGLLSYLNPDPAKSYRNIPWILEGNGAVEIVSGVQKGTIVIGPPDYETGHVLFDFNFHQPIIPQLKRVKKDLMKLQKDAKGRGRSVRASFKPRRDEWTLLLRILDAAAAGARDKEIGLELFPDMGVDSIGKVFDKKEQAMKYVNQDYRLIPYSEE